MAGIIFKNLTGAPIKYCDGEFPCEDTVAFCNYETIATVGRGADALPICAAGGIGLLVRENAMVNFPPQEQDTFLIVTAQVALAAQMSGRTVVDLLVPIIPPGNAGMCTMLISLSEKGFYCNQSEHCGDGCKYDHKNCFRQGESVHFVPKEDQTKLEKPRFVIKDGTTEGERPHFVIKDEST